MSAIEWLLESDDASIRYRTLVELMSANKNDEELQKLKKKIEESASVRSLIGKMHPDGYWLQKNQQSGKVLGQGVEYGSFATTHFCLSYLAEMGMDRSNPSIELAANRYLNLQKEDGDWWEHLSCLYAYNLRTFILLGYGGDPRLQSAWDVLAATKDSLGKVKLDWTPTQCPWKIGKKGDPNEWLTFYTMLAEKYRK